MRLSDREFDRFLPDALQQPSGRFWTPLVVIQTIAEWLIDAQIKTLVDIGSGAGKYAVATALAVPGIRITGVERRPALVATARDLAHTFDVHDRVTFVLGELDAVGPAEAYYLYNPFAENQYVVAERLDDEVPHSLERYADDVQLTEQLLARAPLDTYAIVYNGYGGRIPTGWAQLHVDRYLPNILRMFRKTSSSQADG